MFKEKSGRKPNVPNKVTAKVRDAFALLLENNIDNLQRDIDELRPNERIRVLIQLSEFIIPKLKSIDIMQQQQQEQQLKPIVFQFDFQNDND
jgi:hypothetical protein